MTAAYQLPLPLPGRRRRPPPPIERRTHIALCDLLRIACRPGWLWWHTPNGEHRSPATAALLARMGVRAGVSDFVLVGPTGTHHYLELKRGKAPLSEAQKQFLGELAVRDVTHAVARSASMRPWRACVSGTSCGRAGCSDGCRHRHHREAGRSHGTFDAYLGERLLTTSHQPFLEAARVLLAEGVDPATPLVMRHAGSQTDSLKGTVGAAAKLTVEETRTAGPYFRKWRPNPYQKGPVGILGRRPAGAFSEPGAVQVPPRKITHQ